MDSKKIFTGFNFKSFNAIFSLLLNYLRKQKALWIMMILFFVILFIIEAILFSSRLDDSYFPESIKFTLVNSSILAWNFVPILFLCLFGIPSTLNSIQKSTMIKRIGATRLNERSYISIIWIIYFLMALLIISFTNILELIIFSIFANGFWEYAQGWTNMYFYSLLFVLFSVSFGVFLGVLSISGGRIVIASLSIVIMFFFSGLFGSLTMKISDFIPNISLFMLIIDPVAFVTYFSSMFMYQNITPIFIAISVIYPIVLSLIFFGSSVLMISFDKIK